MRRVHKFKAGRGWRPVVAPSCTETARACLTSGSILWLLRTALLAALTGGSDDRSGVPVKQEVELALRTLDADGSGGVSYDEFCESGLTATTTRVQPCLLSARCCCCCCCCCRRRWWW